MKKRETKIKSDKHRALELKKDKESICPGCFGKGYEESGGGDFGEEWCIVCKGTGHIRLSDRLRS